MITVTRHRRTPALLILLVATVVGVVYVSAWGKIEQLFRKQDGNRDLQALETKIAAGKKDGKLTPATWRAYGEALAEAKQFTRAAAAFKQVLALDPFQRDAKFQCGLALAQAGVSDDLYAFLKDLVLSEAKLAVELFDRAEMQRYLGEERFASLAKEAKNQAMD